MPIRRARAGDATGIIECINQTWSYLRNRNALARGTKDWTIRTLQAWNAAGYEAIVYANSNAGGRIDAVIIYGIENHIVEPDTTPQPWLAIKILAIRVQAVPDTAGSHERLTFLPLKFLLPDAVSRLGVVGLTAQYHAGWDRLHNFLATFTTVTFDPPLEGIERAWARLRAGLPEFTERTANVTE